MSKKLLLGLLLFGGCVNLFSNPGCLETRIALLSSLLLHKQGDKLQIQVTKKANNSVQVKYVVSSLETSCKFSEDPAAQTILAAMDSCVTSSVKDTIDSLPVGDKMVSTYSL